MSINTSIEICRGCKYYLLGYWDDPCDLCIDGSKQKEKEYATTATYGEGRNDGTVHE